MYKRQIFTRGALHSNRGSSNFFGSNGLSHGKQRLIFRVIKSQDPNQNRTGASHSPIIHSLRIRVLSPSPRIRNQSPSPGKSQSPPGPSPALVVHPGPGGSPPNVVIATPVCIPQPTSFPLLPVQPPPHVMDGTVPQPLAPGEALQVFFTSRSCR